MFELIFEDPGAVDAAVGVAELVEEAGIGLGAVARVHTQQPAKALDGVAGIAFESAPFLFADGIDSLV